MKQILLLFFSVSLLFSCNDSRQEMDSLMAENERLKQDISDLNSKLDSILIQKKEEESITSVNLSSHENPTTNVNLSQEKVKQEFSRSVRVKEIGLEVMTEDLGFMDWFKAKKACEALGDGWRLPTTIEFKKIYEHKDRIGGLLEAGEYWTSKEYVIRTTQFGNWDDGWYFMMSEGNSSHFDKNNLCFVRAVRTFTSDEALSDLKKAKEKLDLGLITQEEYEKIKSELASFIK